MNGNEIDKIDFITTPGVKHNASVSAVINIRTNPTYRKGKWAMNGKYGFTRANNYNSLTGYRQILQGQNTLSLTDDNAELYDNRTYNGLLSFEYNMSENHNMALTANWVKADRPNSRYKGHNSFSSLRGLPADSILTRQQLYYWREYHAKL